MFTENCPNCPLYEISSDDEFECCGSPSWEKDDFGNMVEFDEKKHCYYKTALSVINGELSLVDAVLSL